MQFGETEVIQIVGIVAFQKVTKVTIGNMILYLVRLVDIGKENINFLSDALKESKGNFVDVRGLYNMKQENTAPSGLGG